MRYLSIGKFVNTHGIRGEMRILSHFNYKDRVFVSGFPIYIGKEKKKEIIHSYRPHKQFDMITMEGYSNINEVLPYKGQAIYIKREDLKLHANEFLDEDLIGLQVMVNGKIVGTVQQIQDGIQKRIVVNKDEKEYLIPYVCDIIREINLKKNYIDIIYIKGLLD